MLKIDECLMQHTFSMKWPSRTTNVDNDQSREYSAMKTDTASSLRRQSEDICGTRWSHSAGQSAALS
ncbi:Uncharacterised protein [Mycobacteroides abscessus subsp. bolletii]|nr:Uncharacterised protein [Mycobacteroides abscessus subsp. bolletii]SHS69803.1 Uncharacterised protein [Mycobacteroides abscessus subsp. bolletii]SHS90768.1 Uncharacterised protein [Mycobacteroides abscessus subsp. bolletii]SKG47397.1 Uncharacterised protein [Mycobacteroides abscessus subsp. bolletii]SKH10421.1 Uncharacterised protein [Mycobacteroides abscessus subsp. bolletii]